MGKRQNGPPDQEAIRVSVLRALKEIVPAGPPRSDAESMALMLSSRTKASSSLPAYYLVYFLLVDLLKYPNLGQWEKVAWIVPIRYQDRLYSIDHAKMGIGIFAPTFEPVVLRNGARGSGPPSEQAEADAVEISARINTAVSIAEPYYEWRASQAVSTSNLNVVNISDGLFDRYTFFRDRFRSLSTEAERRKDERIVTKSKTAEGFDFTGVEMPAWSIEREARWNGQAAVEAFFAWTEHVFIHLAIFQGKATTGDAVAALASRDWKEKFKSALDVSDPETNRHFQALLELREQIRNFMAHGAFGKRGEAFSFHSGAGAVPVRLTRRPGHRFVLSSGEAFTEYGAVTAMESFVAHLWSGGRAFANTLLASTMPTVLTYSVDGTYARAMESEESMTEFVDSLHYQADRAANMDW